MKKPAQWSLFLALCLLPVLGYSQTLTTAGEGLTAMDLPSGPKATSLGGAFSAWSDDTSAVYWNPAGMAFFPHIQIQTAFNQWFQDSFYQDFGGVMPLGDLALGGRLSYVSLGSFTGRDSLGYTNGLTYSPSDIGGTFAGSVKLGVLAWGLAAKSYVELLPGYSYATLEMDSGLLLRAGFLNLSAGVRNLGLVSNYTFPTEAYTGGALAWDLGPLNFHLATDSTFTTQGTQLHHGVELGFQKTVFLRAGYQWFLSPLADQTQNGASGGVGIKLSDIEVDYSLVTYGSLGDTNQVAIGYQFDLPTGNSAAAEDDEDYRTSPSKPHTEEKQAEPAAIPIPAADLNKKTVQDVYHLGIEAYKKKDYDLATIYFKNAAQKPSTEGQRSFTAQANVMLGVLYEYHRTNKDHLTQAIHYYGAAVKIDSSNATVQKHLDELESAEPSR